MIMLQSIDHILRFRMLLVLFGKKSISNNLRFWFQTRPKNYYILPNNYSLLFLKLWVLMLTKNTKIKIWSSSSSYLFIYLVTSYHKEKTATSSRSITKASK